MVMRILITGGAGCLGSNLVERYLVKGHKIWVIDNFTTGSRQSLSANDNLGVTEGTVCDRDLVERVFKSFKPTHVIHSAASYKDPSDWIGDASTNILGTVNVVKSALSSKVDRFVYFQTSLTYGRPKDIPIPLTHNLMPTTSYGISKTAGELYTLQSSLNAISLRLATVCGPRLSIGPIPTFYKRLKLGQSCFCSDSVREYLDISDFFELIDIVLDKNSPAGTFNVSTGHGHSILDVFKEITNYLGMDLPNVPIVPCGEDDIKEVVLDPSETERILGWRAKISFRETIANQLALYDKYGVDNIFSHLRPPANIKNDLDPSSNFGSD